MHVRLFFSGTNSCAGDSWFIASGSSLSWKAEHYFNEQHMSGNIRSFQNRVTVFVQICLQFILKVINDSWNRWTGLLNRHPRMKLTDWSSEHVSLLKPLMLLLDRLQRGSKAKFISISYKEIQHELVQLELKSLTQQFNNKGGVKKSTRIIRIVYHVSSSKSYKELRWIQALLEGLKDSWEFNNERAFP